MKPRLERAQFTEEDTLIWLLVIYRFYQRHGSKFLARTFATGDRRDAELMYRIEIARNYEREHPEVFVEYAGEGLVHCLVATALRTGPVSFVDSDITWCA
jgi:hypothetical protein